MTLACRTGRHDDVTHVTWPPSRGPTDAMNPYRFELKGGPLAGQLARVTDTEVRLDVVRDGKALHLCPSDEPSEREAARRIGHYGYSHREESLVWFPAIE
jgi:hypothetical protein